jgi:hypothetical protein
MGDPNWRDPEYYLRADWRYIPLTVAEILESAGFCEHTGFVKLVVTIEVNSPFPPAQPIRIKTSKKVNCVWVNYAVRSENLPDTTDQDAWKAIHVAYFADAVDRVFRKFKLDRSRIPEILALSPRVISLPRATGASFSEDTSIDLEINIPWQDSVSPMDQLALVQRFGESLAKYLENHEIARWSGEEVGRSDYTIFFTTHKASETISAIQEISREFSLPNCTSIKMNNSGTITQLRLVEKK